jgi:hypothetical protein
MKVLLSDAMSLGLPTLRTNWLELASEQKASDKVKQMHSDLQQRNLVVEQLEAELTAARQSEGLPCEEYGGLLSDMESTAAAIELLHAMCMPQLLQVRLRTQSARTLCFEDG